ncbi:MAG: UvrB/UvrC motif-containing protein [Pseudomonadota bacterium]
MTDRLAELSAAMTAAAARDDFEEAARLRNELFVLRAGGQAAAEGGDFAGIKRQQPGAMGIGSQHPRPAAPSGWTKPRKPPTQTTNTSRRGKGR